MRTTQISIVVTLAVLGLGCGDDDPPVDVAGSYTVATTNGPNDCELMAGWTAGEG